MRDGRNFLDAFDAEPETRQRADSCLRSWSWGAWSCASWSANLDVYRRDALVPRDFSGCRGCSHCSVRRGLHAVGFHEHASARAADGLSARNVSNVDNRVVVAAENVDDAPLLALLAAAQNLLPPLWPRLPRGCRISGCFFTTDIANLIE
jgi:hypothetical protein